MAEQLNIVESFNDKSHFLFVEEMQAVFSSKVNVPHTTHPIIINNNPIAISPWGDDNAFPQQVIADVRNDSEIGELLDKKARLLYADGITWGKLVDIKNGVEVFEPLEPNRNNKIRDFYRKSNLGRYLIEASKDLYWFYNVFPEIVTSKDRSEIVQLSVQPAEECRWSRQNKYTGLVEHCYINANWPNGTVESEYTITLPVIDPYYSPADSLREMKGTNFIYPLSYPTPGNKFYQLADWNSIRASGWLDVSKQIPTWKKTLMKNQLHIKYHIEISNMFWDWKYPNFSGMPKEEQNRIRKDEIENFLKTMSGTEQAGKAFFSSFKSDPNTGKDYPGWKINEIPNKIEKDAFLEDAKYASLNKMSAIGLHPALVGTMPNNGMGGAGSNIREAYNLHILMNKPHADIILEPLYLVRDYNGWGNDVEFRFKNSLMTTLDKGKETQPK